MRLYHRIIKKAREEAWFHFPGNISNSILISSMGRSGSTWLAQIINHKRNYREIFEPFLPVRVPEASRFEYCQYLSEKMEAEEFKNDAFKLLTGRFKNRWTDVANPSLFSKKQLIKDIRTNLLLGWLKRQFPPLKIILLIRHPYAVVSSWKKLGWGVEPLGERRDLDIILNQQQLLKDFPIIGESVKCFDTNDYVISLGLLWGILNYVPLSQDKGRDQFIVVRYEDLLTDPGRATLDLMERINIKPDHKRLNRVINKPSRTSYEKKSFLVDDHNLDQMELEKINRVINFFHLDYLYKEVSA